MAIENPSFSAETRYGPMRTVKNSKLPFASLLRSALTPVAVFVSVTRASGTTAPDESFTEPTTVAVSNWAHAGAANIRVSVNATHRHDRRLAFIASNGSNAG